MYEIRHAVESDYTEIAAISSLIRPEPSTAQEVLESDRRALANPDISFHRLVAVDEAGRVLGYGFAERASWEPEGRWSVYACAHPDCRGRGVASGLLEAAERIARNGGATEMNAWCTGAEDLSFEWAQRRGYSLKRQRTESVLDLATFDPSRFAGVLDRVRAGGLELVMLEEIALPEALMHGMWELDRITSPDVPMWDAGDSFPSYEQYRKEYLGDSNPRVVAFALDGAKVVGMTSLYLPQMPGKGAGIGYTAVLREYRGRGIALALKLMATNWAKEHGVPHIRTNNDPDNPPMLAVNVKMGFRFIPGPRMLVKTV